jgi:hypothetical protein
MYNQSSERGDGAACKKLLDVAMFCDDVYARDLCLLLFLIVDHHNQASLFVLIKSQICGGNGWGYGGVEDEVLLIACL